MDNITITNPGDLIASIPALIGYTPTDSIICVGLNRDGRIAVTLRMDIDAPDFDALLRHVAGILGEHSEYVVLVVVGGDGDPHPLAVAEVLFGCGITPVAVLEVSEIADGQTWHDRLTDKVGVVSSPQSSQVAFASVLAGRAVVGSREEMRDSVCYRDEPRAKRVQQLMAQVSAATLPQLRAVIDDREFSDVQLAQIGLALRDGKARDLLYCSSKRGSVLASVLAATLPGQLRSFALTAVAFGYYCDGDGPRAGAAIDLSLQVGADNNMAKMLDTALRRGVDPSQIALLADNLGASLQN